MQYETKMCNLSIVILRISVSAMIDGPNIMGYASGSQILDGGTKHIFQLQ